MLADWEILQEKNHELEYSAVTKGPVQLMYIKIEDLKEILGKDIYDLKNTTLPYPDDTVVREIYFQQLAWAKYKKKFKEVWKYRQKFKRGNFKKAFLDRGLNLKQPRPY